VVAAAAVAPGARGACGRRWGEELTSGAGWSAADDPAPLSELPPTSARPALSQGGTAAAATTPRPLLASWERPPLSCPLQMGAVTLHAHPCCLSPLPLASPVPKELPHRGRRDPPSTELGTTARPPSRAISDPVFPLCENPLDPLCLPVQFLACFMAI